MRRKRGFEKNRVFALFVKIAKMRKIAVFEHFVKKSGFREKREKRDFCEFLMRKKRDF